MRLPATIFSLLIFLASAVVHAEVYPSPESANALKVGDSAPNFTVRKADGSPFNFKPEHLTRPQVLIFYRGGWCPYCNLQLSDLHTVEPKLRARGFDVLFFSTDRPDRLYSSPKEKHLSYTLLSDSELKAAEALHIAYHVDETTYAEELAYGVDLEKTTGTTLHELPVPSVFIVDTTGVIRYVYSNPDYTVRLSADELWEAAMPLTGQSGKH
jgi:peroxiredoxin